GRARLRAPSGAPRRARGADRGRLRLGARARADERRHPGAVGGAEREGGGRDRRGRLPRPARRADPRARVAGRSRGPRREVAPMAQRKRSARPRARGRKRRGALHAHHDAELAGLGLIGLGTFAACVLWFGLSGGPVGPAGLLSALGRADGGYAGRGLEWLLALGIGTAGATIAGVLLAVVGALFLTGASLGAIVRRSGHAVRRSGRAVGRVRGRVRRRRARPASAARGVPPAADVVAPRQAAAVNAVHDYPDVVAAPPPLLVYDGAHADDEGEVTEDTQTSLFEALETPPPEYRLPDVSLLRRSSP